MKESLEQIHIPHLKNIVFEDQAVDEPKPLPWYPDDLAWQVNVTKQTIRKCAPYKEFQAFLVAETTIGNISRQEAVSMIPPLLLDIQPHHVVLDMCAAPGSKTAQLIEMLHAKEETDMAHAVKAHAESKDKEHEDYGRPTGVVIANDIDFKRAHMLVHQTKRLNSANIIITNNDSTSYPSVLIASGTDEKDTDYPRGRRTYLKFDRILADVPCTGDGTPRKNYTVWKEWKPLNALSLHTTQVKILVRGLQLLKAGGRIVYSTCSMNPVENEAVVAAAIQIMGGTSKVQAVDVSDQLSKLKRRPGLKGDWKIMGNTGEWWSNYEEALASEEGKRLGEKRLHKTWFYSPPDNEEERVHLEHTLRLYPHLQDTGGFYVAVLQKAADVKHVPKVQDVKVEAPAAPEAEAASNGSTEAKDIEMADATSNTLESTDGGVTPHPHHPDLECPPSPGKRKRDSVSLPFEPKRKRLEMDEGALTPTPHHEIKDEPSPQKEPAPVKKRGGDKGEEFFVFLEENNEALEQIKTFYKVAPEFPMDRFLVRNAGGTTTRAIYYTCAIAKRILQLNVNDATSVKFVHAGVKMFVKQATQDEDTCVWRIQNEGMPMLEAWIGEDRVVYAKKRSTVFALLKEMFPLAGSVEEIKERVMDMQMGCAVLRILPSEGEDGFKNGMRLPLWRSRHTINLMLPKEERRFGSPLSPTMNSLLTSVGNS